MENELNKFAVRIHKNAKIEIIDETDGDWGGASLKIFRLSKITGFILYNSEAHTKDLKLPFKKDIYGTLTVQGIFLPESDIGSIRNTSPKYNYDWSWWGDMTETIFSLVNRDKIWVFKIEGTILQGLKEQFIIMEAPTELKTKIDET